MSRQSSIQVSHQQPQASSSSGSCLNRKSDGLYFEGSTLTYRITGLTPYNLERLRINLKAFYPSKAANFHIDTLDLYYSRARETFAENCTKYLKAPQSNVMSELTELISILEKERITMKENNQKNNPRINLHNLYWVAKLLFKTTLISMFSM